VVHQRFLHPLRSLEPYQLYLTRIIIKGSYQPFLPAFAFFKYVDDRTYQLHIIGVLVYLRYFIYPFPVKVPIRVVLQQIAIGSYFQLLAQQFGTLGANAFQVFYG
jgi:hypothetical protein